MPGTTGSAINFGLHIAAGTYSVVGTDNTTHCPVGMSGSATIVIDPLPTVFTVTGGGSYCATDSGRHVTLSGSQSGVNYRLYNGSVPTGFPVAGTGSALDLGLQAAIGTYTVLATNATTGCTKNMASSVTISITPMVTPSISLSTGIGDSICSGNSVTITTLTGNGGSTPTYQWQVNGSESRQVQLQAHLYYVPANGDVVTATMTSNATCASPVTVSNSLTLAVLAHGTAGVSITANPGNEVCIGATATFSATPTFGGTAPVYTWINNGVPVPGVTGPVYSYIPQTGDIIFCMIVSNYPCNALDTAFSNTIRMKTDTPLTPSVVIMADPGTSVPSGTTVTLTAVVTNAGSNPLYQWYVNGVPFPGATFSTFTNTGYNNLDSVSCVVTSSNACALSAFNSVIIYLWAEGVTQVAQANSDIKLIPNPNKGEFVVKGTLGVATDQQVTLEITDMLGQVVYKNSVLAQNGDINQRVQLNATVANGMYILNLRSDNGETKVFHIVIEQ